MSEAGEQGRRVLDEALRLVDALQARPGATGERRHAGPECAICPVCRGIAHLREANPDAMDRLAGAVVDLGAALRDLLGTASGPAATRPGPGGPGAADVADDVAGDQGSDGTGAGTARVEVRPVDVTD